MNRRTILVAAAAVVVVAAGGLVFAATHHPTGPKPTAARSATPVSTVDTRTAAQRAEDTFIGTTAAHLCNVQFTVYDDPGSLAKAYTSVPEYPGLTADQVADFQRRLTSDGSFSAKLTKQLETACHPALK